MSTQPTLTLVGYTQPGTIIGQSYNPTSLSISTNPLLPCFIGQGADYLIGSNLPVVRGFLFQEKLIFSTSAPFIAPLPHYGDGKQTEVSGNAVQIYNASNVQINPLYWKFIQTGGPNTPYNAVQVFDPNYNPNEAYYIDYQSADATVSDTLGIVGAQTITYCGDRPYESFYGFNQDFQMDTTLAFETIGGDTNSPDLSPIGHPVVGTGTGYLLIDVASKYASFNNTYTIQCSAAPASVIVSTIGSITAASPHSGLAGNLVVSSASNYTGLTSDTYTFTVSGVNSLGLTLTWLRSSDSGTGTIKVNASMPNGAIGPNGLILNVNLSGLVNGVVFTLPITPTSVTRVQFDWYTINDTTSASGLITVETGATSAIALDSGIYLDFGSVLSSTPTLGDLSGFVLGDTYVLVATNLDTIDWNLTRTTTETFTPSEVYYDALGYITGTPRSYYVTLSYAPIGTTSVVSTVYPNAAIPHTDITGKPYVALGDSTHPSSIPLTNFTVTYAYQNAPVMGSQYYVTLNYTRPISMYNTPIIFTDYKTALGQIGYPSTRNHLAIMLDYAFNVAGNKIVSVVQVLDNDHDGTYNTADYEIGLNAAYLTKQLTDIVVLGMFGTIADQIYSSIQCNNPQYGALRMYWFGYPTNYPVGDEETPGTICYTSSKILQVSGASPAHGTFVSVANQWVQRTIVTESGQSVQLTLDGSFFAGMLCALQNAPNNPNYLLLNLAIPGIDAAATFNSTEVLTLGAASNTYAIMPDPATPVITVIDTMTTDTSSSDYHEINVMKAKMVVTNTIINACNSSLVGYIPLSIQDGVSQVTSVILNQLTALVGNGTIGAYTNASGTPRSIQASDIQVWRDDQNNPAGDKTRYDFTYWFNGRYGIKRLVGIYSVDENAFVS